MCFERFPDEIDRTHIVVRLQIQNSGDAGLLPESLNFIGSLRMRTKEELGKDLHVLHGYLTKILAARGVARERGKILSASGQEVLPFVVSMR